MKRVNGIIGIANISASRQRLRVSGGDGVEFLHGQCTNDIKRLAVGGSCYAAFLNAKGKMRGEGHIICLPDAFLLEVNPGLAQSLEKFIITEDVTIEDVSASYSQYLVVGAMPVLPTGAVEYHALLGNGVLVAVAMADGGPRSVVAVSATEQRADATERVPPLGLPVTLDAQTLEVLRIEAAVPKWGVDMDENTIPNEAGLEARAISYDKGCYIGQETIARIKTYGHVNRRLIQCRVESAQVPQRGDKIFEGEREVGHVTSAVRLLRLGKPVALGYVRREFASRGVKLTCNNEPVEVLRVCGD